MSCKFIINKISKIQEPNILFQSNLQYTMSLALTMKLSLAKVSWVHDNLCSFYKGIISCKTLADQFITGFALINSSTFYCFHREFEIHTGMLNVHLKLPNAGYWIILPQCLSFQHYKKSLVIQIHRKFSKLVTCLKKLLLMCQFPVLRL